LLPGYQADAVVLEDGDYRTLAYRFGTNPVYATIKRGQIVYCADGALGAAVTPGFDKMPR
jgi:imidazolonepropionase-like amidohydrolase